MDYEATIMPAIREACDQWNVAAVTYDPYQLHDPMQRLRRENRVAVREFSQQGRREQSDRALYDLIRERRLHHFGALVQPMLSAHVLGANIELRGLDENRMRLTKRSARIPNDAVVALSMAAAEALRLNT